MQLLNDKNSGMRFNKIVVSASLIHATSAQCPAEKSEGMEEKRGRGRMGGGCLEWTKDAVTFVHSPQNLTSAFERYGDHAHSGTRLNAPVKALPHAACGHPVSPASHPEPRPERPRGKKTQHNSDSGNFQPSHPRIKKEIKKKDTGLEEKLAGARQEMEPKQTSERARGQLL